MKKLSELELKERGDWKGYYTCNVDSPDDESGKFAFVWMDRDRRYFIANHSSLLPGKPCTRERLRQVSTAPNAAPEHVELEIPQPKAAEHYYSANAKIDESNRVRQDDFKLERKLVTKDWAIRVNHSIMGMADVDTYYIGRACGWWEDQCPDDFYYALAEEMIDND